ncbi:glycoside hydrolase family protein [Synechococcales cyanobacterium C]|uniref:Glycoside hydrolase family protein n=2 Tax=Petrachloros TaxID=2918834 RepID=A0A8K1ZXR2_9CYAN|nr:glycoside hydrolase family protein [Petrachloros mirabilis ULC683]
MGALFSLWPKTESFRTWFQPDPSAEIAPLAMSGGNPYIRALMRTISASEANDPNPYTLLYGGERIQDLSDHPDICLEIVAGPNQGLCTTAAGRYQFLTTTWEEKAQQYHPNPSGWWWWRQYSFSPEYQDKVVYGWLQDPQAWNTDIAERLEAGQLPEVLERLSGTWTSLGYGIEDNVMTPFLEEIYQSLLAEELAQASQAP